MSDLHYDYIFEPDRSNESHSLTASRVPPGSKVLDLGCSVAALALYLRSQGCFVMGVDNDASALQIAEQRCDRVAQIDLNDLTALHSLDRDFDVILCNDVLEHLLDPRAVLDALRAHIRDDGFVVASIPNVTHGSVRLNLWNGHWNYHDKGILDRTHLKFFDREGISNLFTSAGWFVGEWDKTTAPYDIDLEVPLDSVPAEMMDKLNADPDAQTYQFIVKAYRREALAVADTFEMERDTWSKARSDYEEKITALAQRVEAEASHARNLEQQVEHLTLERSKLRTQAISSSSLVTHLQMQLTIASSMQQMLASQLEDARQESASLVRSKEAADQETQRYRYYYEALRFSRSGRLAHKLGSIKTAFHTARRLWGTRRQFADMARKASHVLVTEGPVQAVEYGVKKLKEPHLRYDEQTRRLNAEEDVEGYQAWIVAHEPTAKDLALYAEQVLTWTYRPLISIVMPVFNVEAQWLRRAVESVRSQVYPQWELCMVDDHSTSESTVQYLKSLENFGDPRIRVRHRDSNGGISAATNDALAAADGEFIALMDHDDELAPHALFRVVDLLQNNPTLDLIYSDEDKIDVENRRSAPFFKPDWSPTLLLGMNYISHLGVYRASVARAIGGFRSEFDGAQDYDFLWRFVESTNNIEHVPDVLYHWRAVRQSTASSMDAKPYVIDRGREAVQQHLNRCHVAAEVVPGQIPARFRVHWRTSDLPRLTVIIPTKDHQPLLEKCIKGLETTDYPNLDVIIVDNGSTSPQALEYLESTPHQVIRAPGPFNFSHLINVGVNRSQGDLVLLLNNDIEVMDPLWLKELSRELLAPGVGIVGPKLVYPDGRVQHGGIILGLGGIAGHAFHMNSSDAYGYFGLQQVTHEVSAVTGACLLTTRHLFDTVGGFREELPVNFNDVAFCLDVQRQGHRVLYDASVTLIHRESASRPPRVEQWEEDIFRRLYRHAVDPYYSIHFSRDGANAYGF